MKAQREGVRLDPGRKSKKPKTKEAAAEADKGTRA